MEVESRIWIGQKLFLQRHDVRPKKKKKKAEKHRFSACRRRHSTHMNMYNKRVPKAFEEKVSPSSIFVGDQS